MWLEHQVTPPWVFLSWGPFVLLTVPALPSATRLPLRTPEPLLPPKARLLGGEVALMGPWAFPSQRQRDSAL